MAGRQVVLRRKVTHRPRNAVAAREQLLGHDTAEAAAHAGDEPIPLSHMSFTLRLSDQDQNRSPTISSLLAHSALACSGSSA